MKTVLPFLLIVLCLTTGKAQEFDTYFQPAKFRNIGPFRGGRANGGSGVGWTTSYFGEPRTYGVELTYSF